MNAKQLISLSASKGYTISRNTSNVYEYGYSNGSEWISNRFNGTWHEFVKFMQAIQPPHTFTLEYKLCDAKPGSIIPEAVWTASFSFNAANEDEAMRKASKWARYQGKDVRDVRVRPSTEHESIHWLHNEWVS